MRMVTQDGKDTPVTTSSLWIQNICSILSYREGNSLGRIQRHRKPIVCLYHNDEQTRILLMRSLFCLLFSLRITFKGYESPFLITAECSWALLVVAGWTGKVGLGTAFRKSKDIVKKVKWTHPKRWDGSMWEANLCSTMICMKVHSFISFHFHLKLHVGFFPRL